MQNGHHCGEEGDRQEEDGRGERGATEMSNKVKANALHSSKNGKVENDEEEDGEKESSCLNAIAVAKQMRRGAGVKNC